MRVKGTILIILFFIASCSTLRNDHISTDGYHLLIEEVIGGVSQAMIIRGERKDNPFLLRLHGGPGYPFFPDIPREAPHNRIETLFNVVYWEQRGTGKSYSSKVKPESMNMEQFISDTHDVIQLIKKKFGVTKVFLWGHSWGSSVGALYASRYPEDLYAYVGTGQSVNPVINEKNCLRTIRKRARDEKNDVCLAEINEIDTVNYQVADAMITRKWLYKYGGIVHKINHEKEYAGKSDLMNVLSTSEYSLFDKLNIIFHPYFSGIHLWDDMWATNLMEQAPEIKVPVYFLLGRYDVIVSSSIAETYFHNLKAPNGKQIIWFEESAHRPHMEEPEKFIEIMNTIRRDKYLLDT